MYAHVLKWHADFDFRNSESMCHVQRLPVNCHHQNATPRPHTAQQRTFLNASKQRLARESDANITEPTWDTPSTLSSRPAQAEPPDSVKFAKHLLSSLFLSLVPPCRDPSTPPRSQHRRAFVRCSRRAPFPPQYDHYLIGSCARFHNSLLTLM